MTGIVETAARPSVPVVSCDGHCGTNVAAYAPYADPEHRAAIVALEAEERMFTDVTERVRSTYTLGDEALADAIADDSAARLKAMDEQGIEQELLFPGVHRRILPGFSSSNEPATPVLRDAGAMAYNRWLADYCTADPSRLRGVLQFGSARDHSKLAPLVLWGSQNHMAGVEAPGRVADPMVVPLHSPQYDELWAACVDTSTPVTFHAGWGDAQGVVAKRARRAYRLETRSAPVQRTGLATDSAGQAPMVFDIFWPIRRGIVELLWGRVFDRWPELTVLIAEVGVNWVPPFVYQLDVIARRDHTWRSDLLPSQYLARNVYVCITAPTAEDIRVASRFWPDRMVIGSDMPHDEGTWPISDTWWSTVASVAGTELGTMVMADNARRMLGQVDDQRAPSIDRVFEVDHDVPSDDRVSILVAAVRASVVA